jgi:hypothetical protein
MADLSPPTSPTSHDPVLTRKGSLSHPGTLLLGALALLFTADVLGYLPQLDRFLGQAVQISRSQGLAIVAPILLGLVALYAIFSSLLVLQAIGNLFRSLSQRIRFSGRTIISLEHFTQSAEAHGISPCTAHETYLVLAPYYPGTMSIQLQDHLGHQLRLSQENILFLQSHLLHRCDRREVLCFSPDHLHTVLDLMRHIETAPPQHVRARPQELPIGTAANGQPDAPLYMTKTDTLRTAESSSRREGDRLPEDLSERRLAVPDGGLHGAPFPGRRRGDYSGIRRRTNDLGSGAVTAPRNTILPLENLVVKAAFFHPRNRSTDFTPRRRGDLPSPKPRD